MDIVLEYFTGRPKDVLTVNEGETPRLAMRRMFGHENEFLKVGGTLPPDMDVPVPITPKKVEVILEEPSRGSDQPVEAAPVRTRARKLAIPQG